MMNYLPSRASLCYWDYSLCLRLSWFLDAHENWAVLTRIACDADGRREKIMRTLRFAYVPATHPWSDETGLIRTLAIRAGWFVSSTPAACQCLVCSSYWLSTGILRAVSIRPLPHVRTLVVSAEIMRLRLMAPYHAARLPLWDSALLHFCSERLTAGASILWGMTHVASLKFRGGGGKNCLKFCIM